MHDCNYYYDLYEKKNKFNFGAKPEWNVKFNVRRNKYSQKSNEKFVFTQVELSLNKQR